MTVPSAAEAGPADRDERLGEAIEEYLALAEGGSPPDPDEFVARYPDLGDDLAEALEGLALVRGLVGRPGGQGARLEAGRRIAGYRIVRELGRGGMGVVYEAVHVDLDRPVALKILGSHAAPDSAGRRRFLNEAKTAAGLHHTHIVPVFDVGQVGGLCYYAMQRIEGAGLDRVLKRLRHDRSTASESPSGSKLRGRSWSGLLRASQATAHRDDPSAPGAMSLSASASLDELSASGGVTLRGTPIESAAPRAAGYVPPRGSAYFRWVAEVGRQAAQALGYAHARGIIHRDIKPSNLLVDRSGTTWVADFGLARRKEDPDLTHAGGRVGTPRYMSPEQADGRPLDPRTDIYSLGATLYELLTLRPPFDGRTAGELARQIAEREPAPPRLADSRIPHDLETIVLKAMAKRPDDRYESAQEVAEDLMRFLRLEPVKARRISVAGRAWRLARRYPATTAITAAATAVVLAVVGWSYARIIAERDLAQAAEQAKEIQRRDAETARAQLQQALGRRYLSDAALVRLSSLPDRRERGLSLLREALAVESDPNFRREARNEALELLALRQVGARRELLTSRVNGMAMAADGSWLATLSEDGTDYRLWDAAGQSLIRAESLDDLLEDDPAAPTQPPRRSPWLPSRIAAVGRSVAVLWPGGKGIRLFPPDADGPFRDIPLPEGHVAWSIHGSPEGSRLVTIERPRGREDARWRAVLWDPERIAAPLAVLGENDPPSAPAERPAEPPRGQFDGPPLIAFGPDGKAMATTTGRAGEASVVTLRSAADGTPLLNKDRKPRQVDTRDNLMAIALGPSGLLATGSSGGLMLWNSHDLVSVTRLQTHLNPIRLLRFDRSGMLAAAGFNQGVELWDPTEGVLITLLTTPERVDDLAFADTSAAAAHDRLLAVASGTTTSVWTASEPIGARRFTGFDQAPASLAFAPDGRMVMAPRQQKPQPLRIWDPSAFALTDRELDGLIATYAAFTDGGRLLASWSGGGGLGLIICDPPDFAPNGFLPLRTSFLEGRRPPFLILSQAADRRSIAILHGPDVMIWADDGGRGRWTNLRLPPEPERDRERDRDREGDGEADRPRPRPGLMWWRAALSSDLRRLYLLRSDNQARAFALDLDGEEARAEPLAWGLPGDATQMALSPDGRALILGFRNGQAARFDTRFGAETARMALIDDAEGNGITAMQFSPDGLLAAATRQGELQLWSCDLSTPRMRLQLPGHQGPITTLAFDADGRRLASGGEDRSVLVWDIRAVKEELESLGLGW
ncbi:MAG: serine/threonine-protein kinase [Isosphaeraceae bacterium]